MHKNFKLFKQSSDFLGILLNNINSGVFILNRDFEIQEFNNSLRTIFGIKEERRIIDNKCGNVLGCIFAIDEGKSCGDTSNCANCVLRKISIMTFNTQEEIYKEKLSRKFYLNGDGAHMKHLLFSTRYISFHNQDFVLVILEDTTLMVEQKQLIETQKQHIEDSIHYSKHIVDALMPQNQQLQSEIFEHFLYLHEKDCIGGDFYWHKWIGKNLYITVGDCTGHGVPGALLSVLGMTLLNDICTNQPHLHANEVLNKLRTDIINYLNEKDPDSNVKDGMDIAFCIIHTDSKTVEFAGAFNPLIVVRNGEMTITEPDRMPVGYVGDDEKGFTNNLLEMKKGDCMYMFSDGFQSQFGGPKDKKYNKRRFYSFLESLYSLPIDKQAEHINNEYQNWRGQNEQVDDVSILGIKFN